MANKDSEAPESKKEDLDAVSMGLVGGETEEIDKNWKASMPIQIQFQFTGPESTKQEVVAQVLQALQLVTKFDIAKLGEPIIEELV